MTEDEIEVAAHFAHAGTQFCAQVWVRKVVPGDSAIEQFSLVFSKRHDTALAAVLQANDYAAKIREHPERYRLFDQDFD